MPSSPPSRTCQSRLTAAINWIRTDKIKLGSSYSGKNTRKPDSAPLKPLLPQPTHKLCFLSYEVPSIWCSSSTKWSNSSVSDGRQIVRRCGSPPTWTSQPKTSTIAWSITRFNAVLPPGAHLPPHCPHDALLHRYHGVPGEVSRCWPAATISQSSSNRLTSSSLASVTPCKPIWTLEPRDP